MELDQIDKVAASVLDGYLVRKDLVRTFSRQFPVPTYVGRVPARPLLRQHRSRGDRRRARRSSSGSSPSARSGPARKSCSSRGPAKRARSRSSTSSPPGWMPRPTPIWRPCPACACTMSASVAELVNEHERMLTGGFYAEIALDYDAAIAQEKNGRPFGIETLRAIQLSKRGCAGHAGGGPEAASPPRSGRTSCCAASASSRTRCPSEPRMSCFCAWFRLSSATTTWSSSGRAARARATSSSRSRPTPT